MLVHIVYLPNADKTGPDLDRIGKVEEVPDELGRLMLDGGEARKPTDEELAAYHAERQNAETLPVDVNVSASTVEPAPVKPARRNGTPPPPLSETSGSTQ